MLSSYRNSCNIDQHNSYDTAVNKLMIDNTNILHSSISVLFYHMKSKIIVIGKR